ncbi:MAG: hypothetical protein K1000chlam2_01704 [Chlamydiae bacterium]|nr:hypothetical protein [Chlamydiota bacterium]
MKMDSIHHRGLPAATFEQNAAVLQQKMEPLHSRYESSLVSSNDQSFVSRLFGMIWSAVFSVFETVFFCCNFTGGIFGNSKIKSLRNERAIFEMLVKEFKTNRDNKSKKDFKAYWAKRFDSLSLKSQERIVKESMVDWAIAKGNRSPEDITDYINKNILITSLRKKALGYVRDLIEMETKDYIWFPKDDSQVPTMLAKIVERLDEEILFNP